MTVVWCSTADNGPCTVLNCPFKMYPPANNTRCVPIDAMRNLNDSDIVPNFGGVRCCSLSSVLSLCCKRSWICFLCTQDQFDEYFLNFEFYPLGINRRRFVMPSSPLLTQYDDANPSQCEDSCAFEPMGCNCTNILTIPFNHTVQVGAAEPVTACGVMD